MRTGSKLLIGTGLGLLATALYTRLRDAYRFTTFQNKVVVITGGSRGLGLVLARHFAAEGALLALLARDANELERAEDMLRAQFPEVIVRAYPCDCIERTYVHNTIENIIQDFGRIDILVNDAGIISSMPLENTNDEDYRKSLDTHFWATYNMVEECLPYLGKGSRIANIVSVGALRPVPHLSAYSTGKFAQRGYSISLRSELQRKGILVTTVCPSLMRTGSYDHAEFGGQYKKEYTLFSILDSLPLMSMDADVAADKILEGIRYGRAELTLSFTAKLAHRLSVHFPELFADAMSLTNRLIPGPTEDRETRVEGKDAHTFLSPSVLTKMSEKAAIRNNEGPIR